MSQYYPLLVFCCVHPDARKSVIRSVFATNIVINNKTRSFLLKLIIESNLHDAIDFLILR